MSLFQKAESKSKRLKMLIFGPSGIGKTVFSLNFPSPSVVDAERGTDFYGEKFDFLRMQTADHKLISSAIDELLEDPGTTKTFVIDPYTKVDESIVLGHLKRMRMKNNNPNYTIQPIDYKSIKEERKLFINKLLSLDMNIIVTAPDKKEYSTTEGDFMKVIGTGPDVPKEVPFMFDIVLEAFKNEDGVRMLRVHKDRTNSLPDVFEMSYNTLVKIIGIVGLERVAEVFTQQDNIDQQAGRLTSVTLSNGKVVKTAGISAEQLDTIQGMLTKENTDAAKRSLLESYAVNSFLDLRSDEAEFFIETLTSE